jgi:hypothetical protein
MLDLSALTSTIPGQLIGNSSQAFDPLAGALGLPPLDMGLDLTGQRDDAATVRDTDTSFAKTGSPFQLTLYHAEQFIVRRHLATSIGSISWSFDYRKPIDVMSVDLFVA